MINLDELKQKAAKSIGGNPALEKQFDFFAEIIAEVAPELPDVWQGGGKIGGKDYKSVKFCWRNEINQRWIELSLYDSYAGSFNVNGDNRSLKEFVTYGVAKAAFSAAFRYVFKENKEIV